MPRRNILWIMCDQLRFDYLSCAGHDRMPTPNIDRLAEKGVRFTRAYANSTICGPSRMCFYTGRYVRSHGSSFQGIPLRVGEPTLGSHLEQAGIRCALVGKTHMTADLEGMSRLGIAPDSIIGIRESECGFEPYERDDGLVPKADPNRPTAYNRHLQELGYDGDNPWEQWANSGEDTDGKLLSGWLLENADKAARIDEPDSESPYMTDRAMEFIRTAKKDVRPWCLHLSYIKPHWPYIVPAPYHEMFGPSDVLPARRSPGELTDSHPLFASYRGERVSLAFSNDAVRQRVIPAYMGLIKQIDDQVGRLMAFLEQEELDEETMVVFTSDHGDYLGDHWLGEKELFHDASVRIPLIVFDPDSRGDAARGSTVGALVEAIDLAPTFLEYFDLPRADHILEGRSLMAHVEGRSPETWRHYAISEYDYSVRAPREELGMPVADCRIVMVCSQRWKYIYALNLPPILFDLHNDPNEYVDLGRRIEYSDICAEMHEAMTQWALRVHSRITVSEEQIIKMTGRDLENNILIGFWDDVAVLEAIRVVNSN